MPIFSSHTSISLITTVFPHYCAPGSCIPNACPLSLETFGSLGQICVHTCRDAPRVLTRFHFSESCPNEACVYGLLGLRGNMLQLSYAFPIFPPNRSPASIQGLLNVTNSTRPFFWPSPPPVPVFGNSLVLVQSLSMIAAYMYSWFSLTLCNGAGIFSSRAEQTLWPFLLAPIHDWSPIRLLHIPFPSLTISPHDFHENKESWLLQAPLRFHVPFSSFSPL